MLSFLRRLVGRERKVTAAEFGERWPLTVEQGIIRRRRPGSITFRAPGGPEYAVNGMARSRGYEEIEPIWRQREGFSDETVVRVSIKPLTDVGMQLRE